MITGALRVVTVNIPIHPLSPLHFLEGINLLRIGSGFCFPWRYVDGGLAITQTCHSVPNDWAEAGSVTWGPCL